MAHRLNKQIFIILGFVLACGFAFAQDEERINEKDYKDPEQFEKFQKRRVTVGAWQINQLKEGALVVRLKTNKMLIDELNKAGNSSVAFEKQLEQHAINKNTMFAYLDNFKFCKVYFMYSHSSDSLLNGTRQGLFLDTNLTVDPNITMNENFYLIAERDYAYNSSIGFVIEDSAKYTTEKGNPVKEMAILVKNKYGHQLKNPFPYYVKEKNFMDAQYSFPITVNQGANGPSIFFTVNRTALQDMKNNTEPKGISNRKDPGTTTVLLKKQFTYEKLSISVSELDENLYQFYKAYPKPDVTRIDPGVKPFLY